MPIYDLNRIRNSGCNWLINALPEDKVASSAFVNFTSGGCYNLMYFPFSKTACREIDNWPAPEAGKVLTLPLLGATFSITIPIAMGVNDGRRNGDQHTQGLISLANKTDSSCEGTDSESVHSLPFTLSSQKSRLAKKANEEELATPSLGNGAADLEHSYCIVPVSVFAKRLCMHTKPPCWVKQQNPISCCYTI